MFKCSAISYSVCYGEEEKNFEWMCSRCIKGELGAVSNLLLIVSNKTCSNLT